MTFAEFNRAIDSHNRKLKLQEQKQASFDYVLADLIGRSIARIYNSSNTLPPLAKVYPSLFNGEEIEEKVAEQRDNLSVARFKQFAQAYNNAYKEMGKEE